MRQILSFKVDDPQERAVDMEDLATIRRIKLEQCVQLATFQADATQVKMLIFSSWPVFHISFLGDAMDPEHGGHADGQLHHPWLPGRGRAAQEGA